MATCEKNEKGLDILPNGNSLVDTRSHFVLILGNDGSVQPSILSMSSTQMKKSRQWMSVMKGIQLMNKKGKHYTPPMFSHTYTLKTVPESNDKGSWFGWGIEIDAIVKSADIVGAAVAFKEAVQGGRAKVDHSKAGGGEESSDF